MITATVLIAVLLVAMTVIGIALWQRLNARPSIQVLQQLCRHHAPSTVVCQRCRLRSLAHNSSTESRQLL
jgi:hypothetical protein